MSSPFMVVDRDICWQDGLCVADCPMGILRQDAEGYPEPVPGAEAFCVDCGHCVAVCPPGALDQRSMTSQDCPPVTWSADCSQTEQFLRGRRSIRQYHPEPLPREDILWLIKLASHAPSGHNRQPVAWLVAYAPENMRKLGELVVDWMRWVVNHQAPLANLLHLDRVIAAWEAGQDRVLRGAPNLVVAHAPEDERTAPMAAATALAYLELAAPARQVGTCWAGYLTAAAQNWPALQEALRLPAGNRVQGALMLGRPKVSYARLPLRRDPKINWI